VDARGALFAACWPTGGCCWCWTTPATPGKSRRCCRRGDVHVVITSRSQLQGLIAMTGAHPLSLDLLSAAESRELLASASPTASRRPAAVADIAEALRRPALHWRSWRRAAASRPGFALDVIAAQLRARGCGR